MKIQVNKKAINFKLQSTSGKIFNLSDIKKGLVVYFYPKNPRMQAYFFTFVNISVIFLNISSN